MRARPLATLRPIRPTRAVEKVGVALLAVCPICAGSQCEAHRRKASMTADGPFTPPTAAMAAVPRPLTTPFRSPARRTALFLTYWILSLAPGAPNKAGNVGAGFVDICPSPTSQAPPQTPADHLPGWLDTLNNVRPDCSWCSRCKNAQHRPRCRQQRPSRPFRHKLHIRPNRAGFDRRAKWPTAAISRRAYQVHIPPTSFDR